MLRRLAFLMTLICVFGCCLSAAAEASSVVDEVAVLIASATADERQEIFGDLVWYMIFVDGAEAVENAFAAAGMFFAGDDIPEELIPDEYAAENAGPTELSVSVPVEKENAYAVEVMAAYMADVIFPYRGDADSALFAAEEGRTCAALELSLTCLYTESIVPEDMTECELIYDGTYRYDGMIFTQLRGEYVPGAAVQPLCSEYVTLVFEIPDSVEQSEGSLVISFSVNGDEYEFTVR